MARQAMFPFSRITVFLLILGFIVSWLNNSLENILPINISNEEYLEEYTKYHYKPSNHVEIFSDEVLYNDDICIVSSKDYSKFGKYYKLQDTIFDDIKPGMTSKEEMFSLNCTHLLYLGHLKLVNDPKPLIDATYKQHGMTLFHHIKDGYLLNIKRFKIKYTRDIALQRLFTNIVNEATLYGNHKIDSFCGELFAFGKTPILVHEKHPYINKIFSVTKQVNLYDLSETDMGCWDHHSNPTPLAKEIVLNDHRPNCDSVKDNQINMLPHWNEWTTEDAKKAKQLMSSYVPEIRQINIPNMAQETGIVMLVYPKIFKDALTNLQFLRTHHVPLLPIEIFHNNELSLEQVNELLQITNLRVVSIHNVLQEHQEPQLKDNNYHYKFAALLACSFRHVLFLDADSMPIIDPTLLFENVVYTETGLVMWPDMWKTNPDNPIYEIVGYTCRDEFEVESGQFIIDRYKHYHTILLSFYMLKDQSIWYKFLFGDKDVLRWASRYLRKPIYIEQTFIKSLGFRLQEYWCGQTMVHSFNGKVVFFHANLLKHSPSVGRWHFGGYQEYEDVTKMNPRFYLLNEWQCIAFNDGKWKDDLTPFEPFLTQYLDFRGIH